MSEIRIGIGRQQAIVLLGNSPLRIVVRGKIYRFERDYAGCPWFLDKHDQPTRIPDGRHVFWQGFNRWHAQGCRLDDDLCVWTVVAPQKVRRVRGQNYQVVETPPGWSEEDGFEVVE